MGISDTLIASGRWLGLAVVLSSLLTQGCSSAFFYPDSKIYSDPAELNPGYQSLYLPSGEDGRIHAWWLPAKTGESKGSLLFFHGNAQNLSSHVINLAWINEQGYDLLIFDYRGFGQSVGQATVSNALEDSEAAFNWLASKTQGDIFILGQSLGAAIASGYVASNPPVAERISGLIVDGTFTGYQAIAREKLGQLWLTWPLQYPLSWIVIPGPDTDVSLRQLEGLPKLLIHSSEDEVIPYHHGETLAEVAAEPKTVLTTDTPHSYTFTVQAHRRALLRFLQLHASKY